MALKFLNKKGWHTGSLRNIENVWKAEQKHDAEQKKLEELRKQIQEERERSEFRLLQEQAGLVPKQERLDFLYDSGLAVGKGGSDGFRELEAFPKPEKEVASSSSAKASMPGALFEEKPQSANDAWRKLHSDPLLMIRQREQEALARVRNNPIQMAMIRNSVEEKKHREKTCKRKDEKKLRERKLKHHRHASPLKQPCDTHNGTRQVSKHMTAKFNDHLSKARPDAEGDFSRRESRKNHDDKDLRNKRRPSSKMTVHSDSHERNMRNFQKAKHDEYPCDSRANFMAAGKNFYKASSSSILAEDLECELHYKRRNAAPKLSEEERVARLREMQADAELHEEQRCKRLRKAEEDDVLEVTQAGMSGGRNFLDAAQTRVYGAEEGGSSTIEESVRRRTHYLQGKSEANAGNAFRR